MRHQSLMALARDGWTRADPWQSVERWQGFRGSRKCVTGLARSSNMGPRMLECAHRHTSTIAWRQCLSATRGASAGKQLAGPNAPMSRATRSRPTRTWANREMCAHDRSFRRSASRTSRAGLCAALLLFVNTGLRGEIQPYIDRPALEFGPRGDYFLAENDLFSYAQSRKRQSANYYGVTPNPLPPPFAFSVPIAAESRPPVPGLQLATSRWLTERLHLFASVDYYSYSSAARTFEAMPTLRQVSGFSGLPGTTYGGQGHAAHDTRQMDLVGFLRTGKKGARSTWLVGVGIERSTKQSVIDIDVQGSAFARSSGIERSEFRNVIFSVAGFHSIGSGAWTIFGDYRVLQWGELRTYRDFHAVTLTPLGFAIQRGHGERKHPLMASGVEGGIVFAFASSWALKVSAYLWSPQIGGTGRGYVASAGAAGTGLVVFPDNIVESGLIEEIVPTGFNVSVVRFLD